MCTTIKTTIEGLHSGWDKILAWASLVRDCMNMQSQHSIQYNQGYRDLEIGLESTFMSLRIGMYSYTPCECK